MILAMHNYGNIDNPTRFCVSRGEMKNSEILRDLKKDRLRTHLNQVEELIRHWNGQLSATEPFSSISSDIWPLQYRPPLEADADKSHMLHRHVHRRAFWKHYTDWTFKLDRIRDLGEPLVKLARCYMESLANESPNLKYTELFVRTALDEAFHRVSGRSSNRDYEPHSERGLSFGSSVIEQVAPKTLMTVVEKDHRELVEHLVKRPEWKEIGVYWREVKKTEESMGKIVNDILKSSDIFYPCRFCRKLSQA